MEMKIVADENLAFTDYFFSEFATIEHRAGRTLTRADVQDAQALLVRSVTRVNRQLIEHTPLQFVGSATIGTDHLDIAVLEQQQVAWSNAAGCNAQAVAEYVITALLHIKPELLDAAEQFTLGIIGLGNVGSRLAYMAHLLGWKVIGYDPLVSRPDIEQVPLVELLSSANAVSLHVPLTQSGDYPTYHLINAGTLKLMQAETILINSARGPVIEEQALMADITKTGRAVVLDVFEHEPVISEALLQLVRVATPHIAGYSLEGKARGTQMIYEAFCQHFGFAATKHFESQLPTEKNYFSGQPLKTALKNDLTDIYNIAQDDANLRACLHKGQVDQQAFDSLRKNYPLRREWSAHGGPQA